MTHATFHDPGTYVLRVRADDGGLYDDEEVTARRLQGWSGHVAYV